ncbi:MAG: YlzJ-like family protein [Peptococcaceae bacterium]
MDVLYTTIPLDIVMDDKQAEGNYAFQDIEYHGIEMQVEALSWNKFKIIRLYSTDPVHYLDERLQPGSIISF